MILLVSVLDDMSNDRHVMEALGMAKVVVEDGKVVEVSDPIIDYCPLFFKNRGIERFTRELVKQNIEFRIKDFGIFTERREMRMKDFLHFGISELMSMCVSEGILDCAVTVCDGSGTVVVDDPELIQGIGGRISGLVETSPIQSVIEEIGNERVLDPGSALIDQVAGARKAMDMGYRKIGVTVVDAGEAALIRKELGNNVILFGVHTTGISENNARTLLDNCDVVTACASKFIWKLGKEMGAMQIGTKVPIFATTELGKNICSMRLLQINKQAQGGPDEPAVPLL